MSMGESGVAVAFDSTNSMTGTSAHCMARCRIDVPSVRALGSCSDDLLSSPSVDPAWSLMALDIAAVSPFLSDSNTLNSFTDCSIEVDLVGELGDCWKLEAEGLRLSWPAPALDMLVERCGFCFLDRLRLCPEGDVTDCEGCELEEMAVLGGLVSLLLPLPVPLLPSVVGTSVLDVTRERRFLTLADLERLCLRRVVRRDSGASHNGLPRPPHVPRHDGSISLERAHLPFHGCVIGQRAKNMRAGGSWVGRGGVRLDRCQHQVRIAQVSRVRKSRLCRISSQSRRGFQQLLGAFVRGAQSRPLLQRITTIAPLDWPYCPKIVHPPRELLGHMSWPTRLAYTSI